MCTLIIENHSTRDPGEEDLALLIILLDDLFVYSKYFMRLNIHKPNDRSFKCYQKCRNNY